jgi:hypothetical protein
MSAFGGKADMTPTISDFSVPAQSRIVPVEVASELGNDIAGKGFYERGRVILLKEASMRASLQKLGIITATALVVAGTSITLPTSANARWGGGWHGGGWHGGHGGWGWGGFGVGLGTGLLVGAATAPYYGGYYGYSGYYGGPYDYGYSPEYAYDYGYSPDYAYYDEPYESGYYGYGGPYVSYGYSNYRRPYYRNGGYYARAHSYGSGSYARANTRDGGSYARANAREGSSYAVRSEHIRISTTHHHEHQR